MNEDINLALKTGKQKNKTGLILAISFGLFFIIFIASAILIFYSLILKSKLSEITQKREDFKSKISALAVKKEKLIFTTDRLNTIQKVISSRNKIDQRLGQVITSIPASFPIEGIQATDNSLSLKISAPALSEFDKLFEKDLPDLAKNKAFGITRIEIASFSLQGASYLLSLNIHYGSQVRSRQLTR
ncbi:MAG: hypothetical protein A2776_01040 [Candidatus Levybacteria bacterium RIFCSPHIGHO2_01_FULL_40_10]|nr:MAG: hypothetical protein A2776_01040 [Candidatus Levybacteria bacterium RIFCSPHIGHO2_01_FULL_40_10]